ncbi:MAG: flagellar hook-length control protein FliK [Deltaproteobacteria bacterium]|nr:flagellar hook-length control protein FliK [Deltaproteobacteria bacterium]
MSSTNMQVQNVRKEERVSNSEQNKNKQNEATTEESSFLKVLQNLTGAQAQAIKGAISINAIPEVKAAEVVEESKEIIVEEDAQVEVSAEEHEAENEKQEDVKVADDDTQKVFAVKVQEAVKEVDVQKVVVQDRKVVEQVATQDIKVQAVKQEVKQDQKNEKVEVKEVGKFNFNEENSSQTATKANKQQKNGNEAVIQNANNNEELKTAVQDQDKNKIQQARNNEELKQAPKQPLEKMLEPMFAKAEQAAEVNVAAKAADKSKIVASLDGLMGRNPQLAAIASEAARSIATGSAENSSKQNSNNAVSGLQGATEKTAVKKQQTAAANELPKKTQDQIIEKLQQMIETAAKIRNGSTMTVRLDPPELGNLTMKLTHRADQIFARIIPETADVEAMLRNRSNDLVALLVNCGFKADNVHISFGQEVVNYDSASFGQMMNEQGFNGSQNEFNGQGGESAQSWIAKNTVTPDKAAQTGWVA